MRSSTAPWARRMLVEPKVEEASIVAGTHAFVAPAAQDSRPVGSSEPQRRGVGNRWPTPRAAASRDDRWRRVRTTIRIDGVDIDMVPCVRAGQVDVAIASVAASPRMQQRTSGGERGMTESVIGAIPAQAFVQCEFHLDGVVPLQPPDLRYGVLQAEHHRQRVQVDEAPHDGESTTAQPGSPSSPTYASLVRTEAGSVHTTTATGSPAWASPKPWRQGRYGDSGSKRAITASFQSLPSTM